MAFEDAGFVDADVSGYINATQVDTIQPDFYLTVGGDPVPDVGGVPFGVPDAQGNVSLSDVIRSGGESESWLSSNLVGSGLSDVLRSGGDSPGFDPSTYNSNVPGQPSDWSIMDVIGTVTKIGGAVAGALGSVFGKSGSTAASKPGGTPSTQGGQSLSQRIFGVTPGPSGAVPSTFLMGALVAVLAFMGFVMLSRARRA